MHCPRTKGLAGWYVAFQGAMTGLWNSSRTISSVVSLEEEASLEGTVLILVSSDPPAAVLLSLFSGIDHQAQHITHRQG
jgi:hypothetical protein